MKNLKLKKMPIIKKYKTIIQQDDCMSKKDSSELFNKEFTEHFGMTVEEVTKPIIPIDAGDTFIYLFGDYKILNEIGLWRVDKLQE